MSGLLDFLQSASNSVASNVSAPVDGLAWLMRKLGAPIPSNPVGGSDWMEQKGLTKPVKQSGYSLAGETAGLISPMLAAAKAPQIARGLLQGADNLAAPRQLSTQAGVFIGPGAKTWNSGDAAKASALTDAGTDARKVWSETGTWKGPDGKWRQEIPDNTATLHPLLENGSVGSWGFNDKINAVGKGGLLQHEGLLKAYPEAGRIATEGRIRDAFTDATDAIRGLPANAKGAISADKNMADSAIYINAPASQAKSTALHELQHAVQYKEGFARGGNSQMAFTDPQAFSMYKNLLGEMNTPMSMQNYAKQAWGTDSITQDVADAYKTYSKNIKKSITPAIDRAAQETAGREYYKRLAGEAEARATQARIPLNAAQRRATFPADSYDYPLDQLIIRGQDNGKGLLQADSPAASKPFIYPQDKALATAQLNAAKSLDEGGLGLAANNTPAQRAQAMGFTDDTYHGTNSDVRAFNRVDGGNMWGNAHYTTNSTADASEYATGWHNRMTPAGDAGANVMPLQAKGNLFDMDAPVSKKEIDKLSKLSGLKLKDYVFDSKGVNVRQALAEQTIEGPNHWLQLAKYDGIKGAGSKTPAGGAGDIQATFDPKNIRSRFAAFDPARRNEADILGRADPELLKLMAGGLLGYGGYSAMKD